MIEVRRNTVVSSTGFPFCGYKIGTYGTVAAVETAISGGTVKAGDNLFYIIPNWQTRYGYVNSGGTITLTPQ